MKSPKVFFVDSGLACHLLGIETEEELQRSVFRGPLFEGFVASEIAKNRLNANLPRNLYYFRDRQGLEVDLMVPAGGNRIVMIEVKAARTVTRDDATPMIRLRNAMISCISHGFVVHAGSENDIMHQTVAAGIRAVPAARIAGVYAGYAIQGGISDKYCDHCKLAMMHHEK